jgi:hypothetical protein
VRCALTSLLTSEDQELLSHRTTVAAIVEVTVVVIAALTVTETEGMTEIDVVVAGTVTETPSRAGGEATAIATKNPADRGKTGPTAALVTTP